MVTISYITVKGDILPPYKKVGRFVRKCSIKSDSNHPNLRHDLVVRSQFQGIATGEGKPWEQVPSFTTKQQILES
jgi:hypothetical protein